MQKISIETTQNVKIDYALSGLGTRIGAFLLDGLVLFAYGMVILFFFADLIGNFSPAVSIILSLPVFTYHLIFEIFMNGQSIGKKQVNIKVIKLDGTPPGLSAFLLRWLLRPVDILFFGSIAMVSIILTQNGQRLGDLAAGTTVIKTNNRDIITPMEIIKNLEDDYQPVFQEAQNLRQHDIELILEALRVFREYGNRNPSNRLKEKMESMLNVSTQLQGVQFLWTLVKDYYYYSSKQE